MADSMSSFTAVPRSKVYAGVAEQILQSIRSGEFPSGSVLPAERALAERLKVSRGSLREAIRVLEHAGVLEVRVGSGTYVADADRSATAMLRVHAAVVGDHSPLDVIVARAAVEPVCAELAAGAHTRVELERMQDAIDRHAAMASRGEDPTEADFEFHVAVAAASHNRVLMSLEAQLVDLMHEPTWSVLKDRSNKTMGEEYLNHHRLILDAIEQRDARQARRTMTMHMSAIESGFLASWRGTDASRRPS